MVYSYSIKIHALGFSELLESTFCLLLVVEAFSLQKVVKILEAVVVLARGQVKMADEAKLGHPIRSAFEVLSLLILPNNNVSFLGLIVTFDEKGIFTIGDDQLSGWSEKFQSTSQSQTFTKKRS